MEKSTHNDEEPTEADKSSRTNLDTEKTTKQTGDNPSNGSVGTGELPISRRSTSRDSSVNDDPRSLLDSISATSGRQTIWSSKDVAEDDPSVSSIKGDSISATIADYNRKHRAQTSDNQSRISAGRINNDCTSRNDDSSVNINYFGMNPGSSTSGVENFSNTSRMANDLTIAPSQANIDAFDIIEESSNISSFEDIEGPHSSTATVGVRKPRDKHMKPNKGHSRHHRHRHKRHSSSIEHPLDIEDLPLEAVYQIEPIIIRALLGRVSKEEFDRTIRRINTLLNDQQSLSAKILLFGSLFCCCSLGFSLIWPSMALKKRSKTTLEKYLASENNRLYSKLGLNWKLAEQRCYSNHAFVEYVLMIEFTPKINLYLPD